MCVNARLLRGVASGDHDAAVARRSNAGAEHVVVGVRDRHGADDTGSHVERCSLGLPLIPGNEVVAGVSGPRQNLQTCGCISICS